MKTSDIKAPARVVNLLKGKTGMADFGMEVASRIHPELPHKHEYFSILFFLTGGCRFRIEGRETEVRPGQIFFIPPYQIHHAICEADVKAYFIYFNDSFFQLFRPSELPDLDVVAVRRFPECAPFLFQRDMVFELQGNQKAEAELKCEIMLHEYLEPTLSSEEIICCTLKLFLLQVVRAYQPQIEELIRTHRQTQSKNESVLRILGYISRHLSEKITLDDLSKSVSLSPNYVSHLVKRETGKNITELITEKRLERAKELLQFTRMRLKEVAEQVGFEDESYFSKRFKAYIGKTPREFRETVA